MNKHKLLTNALSAREDEVAGYQINIDNYTLALAYIAGLPEHEQQELAAFREHLNGLLASERLEQKKAKVMLAVIKQQLE